MSAKPTLFFLTAALFGLIGMLWGIQMSASQDHSLSPAHGHLNLLGFVMMSVFGTYYALVPAAAASRLAWVHFGASVVSVAVLVPGIVLAITEQGDTLAKLGSVLAVLTMALFVVVILRYRKAD
jgi:bacteriorhodopsin